MATAESVCSIQCMHSELAAGGVADVWWDAGLPEQLDSKAERVRVHLVPHHDAFRAESYATSGRRIQFCGHGALAAGRVALDKSPTAQAASFYSKHQRWQARRVGDEAIGLLFRRPKIKPCRVPDYLSAALGVAVQAAAEVGEETDYLIARLANPEAVQAIQLDAVALTAATGRAVIATACASEFEFVFRYFAPQYGTPEDDATGSAAVQLGAYWGSRLPIENFNVWQLSRHGAEMQVSCRGSAVELIARVAYR